LAGLSVQAPVGIRRTLVRATTTKPATTPRRAVKPEDRLLKEPWSEIARDERAVLKAVTKVVETVPAQADVIDSALAFAVRILKSQREALVPLLEDVTPKLTAGGTLPSAADAVKSAYGLAERVLETQRTALRGLVETVTPPLARHAKKANGTAREQKRAPSGRGGARRTSEASARATERRATTRRVSQKTS
jgi:hypothetical protein